MEYLLEWYEVSFIADKFIDSRFIETGQKEWSSRKVPVLNIIIFRGGRCISDLITGRLLHAKTRP
jgi:hypothetical protein